MSHLTDATPQAAQSEASPANQAPTLNGAMPPTSAPSVSVAEAARRQMLELNVRQKDFYESRFDAQQVARVAPERAANAVTNGWSVLRAKLVDLRRATGVEDELYVLHQEWMSDIQDARVLDLGCFAGNHLSLWIAEHCADYTGIDLSEQATAILEAQLRQRGLDHARAYAQDFLDNPYPDNHFDLIYAYSVLHHFKNMTVLLEEMHRVLKPGGQIISFDPMMTEPANRLARRFYRPLQSDRDWEWPFTHSTFRLLRRTFQIVDMRGLLGMVKLGFPFQLVPGLESVGRRVGQLGVRFDNQHARRLNLPFFLCWQVTLRLRKPL